MAFLGTVLLCAGGFLEVLSGRLGGWVRAAADARHSGHGAAVSNQREGDGLWKFPDWFPDGQRIRELEAKLIESSWASSELRPRVQGFLTAYLRAGNSQVVVGSDGDLFFRKDCEYVIGAGFLDPERIRRRSSMGGLQSDPVRAIVDFRDQLAGFGVDLMVVPVPVKPVLSGAALLGSGGQRGDEDTRQNASFELFKTRMLEAGVFIYDPAPILSTRARSLGERQFLFTDTHWKPEAMEAVAKGAAEAVGDRLGGQVSKDAGAVPQRLATVEVKALGDTFALLGLGKAQKLWAPESVAIHPVGVQGAFWRGNPGSDVLLLGDSFSNIYSVPGMGWGEAAGFAEHLSVALGRSVDAITRNSDGAFATRQMLQREMLSGRNRLAGKRIVVWEFAVRELMFGDWKQLPLTVGEAPPASFYCPPENSKVRILGMVREISRVPRPGSVPYQEHIASVHLGSVELIRDGGKRERVGDCLVYAWSMRTQQLTDVARLRAGEMASFDVTDWTGVGGELEKYQRSECADPRLLAEPPVWGEWVPVR
jgi:alginate O-acetyltransferase complex protein AlgJ